MKNFLTSELCDHFHQANPSDPENFPFVVIGNKIDIDGGNSRVVCFSLPIAVFHVFLRFQKLACIE